jgi:hypothetical protein
MRLYWDLSAGGIAGICILSSTMPFIPVAVPKGMEACFYPDGSIKIPFPFYWK